MRAARAGARALLGLFDTADLAHETARRVAAHALSSAVGGTPNRTLELLRSADAEVSTTGWCPHSAGMGHAVDHIARFASAVSVSA